MASTILVPLDGSVSAERALPYAAALARARQGQIVLVCAQPPDGTETPTATNGATVSHDRADLPGETCTPGASMAHHDTVVERLRAEGLRVDLEQRPRARSQSGVADTILEVARERDANLIVMATRARAGFTRWLLGSVADAVVRGAAVPVLLTRTDIGLSWPTERPLRIMVPLDGSIAAEGVLCPLRELVGSLNVELILVRAVGPWPGVMPDDEVAQLGPWVHLELQGARRYLEDVAGPLRIAGLPVRVRTVVGQAQDAVPAVARDERVDLVAMTTHGRSGVTRLALGSVSAETLRHASAPVLLVRPTMMGLETAVIDQDGRDRVANVPLDVSELQLLIRGLGELLVPPGRASRLEGSIEALRMRLRTVEEALLGAPGAEPSPSLTPGPGEAEP